MIKNFATLTIIFLCFCINSQAVAEGKDSSKVIKVKSKQYYELYKEKGGREKGFYDYVEDGRLKGGTFEQILPTPTLITEYGEQALLSLEEDVEVIEPSGACWSVTTVINNGPASNRVDWVIMGDGYTAGEMNLYHNDVQNILNGWFGKIPFNVYASYFNVYRVEVISNEPGIDDHNADPPVYKDTPLNMGRSGYMVMIYNTEAGYAAAACAPARDTILAIANTDWYGGAGGSICASAGHNVYTTGLVLHEMGHTFGNLYDEYGGSGTYSGPEPAGVNVSIYRAADMQAQQKKWFRWLDLAHIDTFEGAYYKDYGIYRPTNNGIMNWLGEPRFWEVCEEELIFQIYKYVSPIDAATPTGGIKPEGTSFFVTPMQPAGYNLDIQWAVDGINVPGATGRNFTPDYANLSVGNHQVAVMVTDNTTRVRNETRRAQLMKALRTWTVNAGAPTPNPATFDIWPATISSSEIFMLAAEGSDPEGAVEYYFSELSGNEGGSDSGWQASREYTDSNLVPNTSYIYTVKMRDIEGRQTQPSTAGMADTMRVSDFDVNSIVNYADLEILLQDWLVENPQYYDIDLYPDEIIDFRDIAVFAKDWMNYQPLEASIISPPDLSIISPQAQSFTITVGASSSAGDVVKVEFIANGTKIGEDTDGSDGWRYEWTGFPDGYICLTAKAYDEEGNKRNAQPVNIYVGGL